MQLPFKGQKLHFSNCICHLMECNCILQIYAIETSIALFSCCYALAQINHYIKLNLIIGIVHIQSQEKEPEVSCRYGK